MMLMRAAINKPLCFSRTGVSAAIPESITFYAHRVLATLLIPLSALHVSLGHLSLNINSTRSLLRGKLPALSTTTAVQTPSSLWLETDFPTLAVHPLQVQENTELSADCMEITNF
ncbi:MAG: hypothetical protein ABL860_00540 [Candidatus Nitrotoga sp.]